MPSRWQDKPRARSLLNTRSQCLPSACTRRRDRMFNLGPPNIVSAWRDSLSSKMSLRCKFCLPVCPLSSSSVSSFSGHQLRTLRKTDPSDLPNAYLTRCSAALAADSGSVASSPIEGDGVFNLGRSATLHAPSMPLPRKPTRVLLFLAALTLIGAAFWLVADLQSRPSERIGSVSPTVVFVVMDTVRADRTSLCGYRHPTTPMLEELVARGASFACDSHSPSTWTLPSHASFFTGRDLDQHQAGGGGGEQTMAWGTTVTPLSGRWPTLAEEMSARGYQTIVLSANPLVEERMGLSTTTPFCGPTMGFRESLLSFAPRVG